MAGSIPTSCVVKKLRLVALALVLAVEVGYLAQTLVFSHGISMTASVLPAAITDLTNQQREENNLPDLETSPLLTEAAQDKANDMAAKGVFLARVSERGQAAVVLVPAGRLRLSVRGRKPRHQLHRLERRRQRMDEFADTSREYFETTVHADRHRYRRRGISRARNDVRRTVFWFAGACTEQ